ncbi:hypothetical protein JANAI62_35530 [Jannaschia pagri]|uniref:Phage integrase family protein n=2 Tax=Roseobacteraceae TaxID=2854170 RepID=A0ABQ4NRM1_9RHOB|nr:hypothetical protein JANAI61_36210 [Jannaschia sp. AI_61]GIT96930.1 hypothetical protein JANAI62_35530 [Jannaschia sp. AI_62]
MIAVKYAKTDPRNGNLNYRRRVPNALKPYFPGKTMLVKALGKGGAAMIAYGRYHDQIEHLLALAKNGVTGLSQTEQQTRLKAMLKKWEADPHSPGLDDNERTWRSEAADQMLAPYQDPDTGVWSEVPAEVEAQATALLTGIPKTNPEPTITDAFKFYLVEKAMTIPEKRKKQQQRFRRAEQNLIAAVASDKLVSQITREDARNWRDMRLATKVSPDTVRREKNDIHAVIALAQSELDASGKNQFTKLTLPKPPVSRQQQREPLPPEVIAGVYERLEAKRPDLLPIWTLLDFTGARPSEISQLLVGEIALNHPVPHIIIHERDDRTLKTSWSIRQVPLVGAALEAAKKVVRGVNNADTPAFPRYFGEGGMDNLSQALRSRVRALTKNPKHVPYSLRHNMKDRLIAAEVFHNTQTAIQGHASGSGEEASYGSAVSLEQKRDALLKALDGYRSKSVE